MNLRINGNLHPIAFRGQNSNEMVQKTLKMIEDGDGFDSDKLERAQVVLLDKQTNLMEKQVDYLKGIFQALNGLSNQMDSTNSHLEKINARIYSNIR